ncbi:MAG: hypothetical protein ABI396_01310, partial [Ktedonobacteraceae bacterium]
MDGRSGEAISSMGRRDVGFGARHIGRGEVRPCKEIGMRHLLRRLGFYLVALWASVTLNFLIPHLSPGNPAQALMARMRGKVSPQAYHALEISLGVNHDALWSQYLQYINNLLHGNLGISITYLPTPVAVVISQDLPWTLVLVGVALVI